MKVTASVLLIATAIAPVVANGFEAEDSLVTRDDNEFENSFARDFDLELEEREFEDDLFEREPRFGFLKKAFGFGRKFSSVSPPQSPSETREFNNDLSEREFEELYGRVIGGGSKGRMMRSSGGSMGRVGRMMRSSGGGRKSFGRVGRVASAGASETPTEREFDDDLLEREFEEELYVRAGTSPKPKPKPVSGHGSGSTAGDKNKDEIKARIAQIKKQIEESSSDYDREKLQERLAKLGGRSFDEMELLEREYYD